MYLSISIHVENGACSLCVINIIFYVLCIYIYTMSTFDIEQNQSFNESISSAALHIQLHRHIQKCAYFANRKRERERERERESEREREREREREIVRGRKRERERGQREGERE